MKYVGKVEDAAKTVDARGCTALTELKADAARTVYVGAILWYWHIHHESLFELEREPIPERLAYIRAEKPKHEIDLRLRLLKPIKDQARFQALYAVNDLTAINQLHQEECADCPWDGTTIFPRKSE